MKKLFFLGLMLMTMTFAQAQLKVTPKMQKGDVKNYATTSVTTLPGQAPMTISMETILSVVDKNTDGYTLDITYKNITSDVASTNIAGQLMTAASEVMKDMTLHIKTDADGKVLKIVNFPDFQKQMDAKCDQLADQMLKTIPQIGQLLPKEVLKQQILESGSEENIIRSLQSSSSPLALSGKTLMTGAQEEYTNEQNLKMKRMYFVNGNNVTSNGSLNMTKDELKAFIIQQVEKTLPDQAEMVKQNIDQLMNSGMLKIDMKETATYEVLPDGWLKSIKTENTTDSMGQNIKSSTTVTLK